MRPQYSTEFPLAQAARVAGFNVTYGDGSRASVIKAFGVTGVRAFVVVYTARRRSVAAVENLRAAFPDTPIWARALDLRCTGFYFALALMLSIDCICPDCRRPSEHPSHLRCQQRRIGLLAHRQLLHSVSANNV